MSSTQRPLNGFEKRLLAELQRAVAAEREVLGVRQPVSPSGLGWSRRVAVTGGVAAVLAVASAAGVPLLVGGEGTEPAYAVTPNGDGTVTVEISSLRDADGLEAQLRKAGIPTAVQYVPSGKTCKAPTFTPAQALPGGGRHETGIVSTGDGAVRFTIDTGEIPTGQTLVISTQELAAPSGAPQGASSIAIAWAEGEVEDCELVDAKGGAGIDIPA